MSFNKEIAAFNDKLYIIVRKFRDHHAFPTTEAKEYYFCDTVLRKDGLLYICQTIEDAQVIEEHE